MVPKRSGKPRNGHRHVGLITILLWALTGLQVLYIGLEAEAQSGKDKGPSVHTL